MAYRLATSDEPPVFALSMYGAVKEFDTAKLAIDFAKAVGLVGFTPQIIVDSSWCHRENERIMSGTYQALAWPQWKLHPIEHHYAHVSMDDLSKVAFTESPEKGMQDRQTRMLPGKYLAKFYPELTQVQIQHYSDQHRERYAGLTLLWAETPDEIEAVYSMNAGFSSCVQHPANHFQSPVHPCRIYGAGDLSLAYLLNSSGTQLLARALVWRAKDLIGRAYGDTALLSGALKLAGHTGRVSNHGYATFDGAKLLKIKPDDYLVAPYIDGIGRVTDYGDHLKIDQHGDHECQTSTCEQSGYESSYDDGEDEDRGWCERCEDSCDRDDMDEVYVSPRRAEHWCANCVEYASFSSDITDRRYSEDSFTSIEAHVPGRRYASTICLEVDGDDYFCSDYSDGYFHVDTMITMSNDEGDWSKSEFEINGFTCGHDGLNYSLHEDTAEVDGVTWLLANAKRHAMPIEGTDLYTIENITPRCVVTLDMLEAA
jgi:hypothetical protein